MKTLLYFAAVAALATGILIGAAIGADPATGKSAPDEETSPVATVEAWAAREFARLAAAEMIYRYVPVTFDELNPATQTKTTTYYKAYRELTGYEVKDVYRTGSLKYPLTAQIRFDYDLYMTSAHWNANALEEAKKDKDFELRDRYSLYRWYKCDEEGRHIGELFSVLPRPRPDNLRLFQNEPGSGLLNPYPPGEAPRSYPTRNVRTVD